MFDAKNFARISCLVTAAQLIWIGDPESVISPPSIGAIGVTGEVSVMSLSETSFSGVGIRLGGFAGSRIDPDRDLLRLDFSSRSTGMMMLLFGEARARETLRESLSAFVSKGLTTREPEHFG